MVADEPSPTWAVLDMKATPNFEEGWTVSEESRCGVAASDALLRQEIRQSCHRDLQAHAPRPLDTGPKAGLRSRTFSNRPLADHCPEPMVIRRGAEEPHGSLD